ncbi:MAG TPA: glycogen debranching enzyme N-terminal domain-containing protein, partial [Chryseosolibacter sp.]|nr:glycogen debranching enzyme N-terminal domain-containing protein [Chryseosolibacter sp.]
MNFSTTQLTDFQFCSSLEWLETNGIGGYASSTVSGANTRRYHGLLVASLRPPLERRVVLSKLDDRITIGDEIFELSANQYPGAVHPTGFQNLISFDRFVFPEFTYKAGGVKLRKTIACIHGQNTTVVMYNVIEARNAFTLELMPFCSFKDFHTNAHANDSIYRQYLFEDGLFRTKNYQESSELFIYVPGSEFRPGGHWYYNFEYLRELDRGLDFREDLFNHGKFLVPLKKGDQVGVVISTENCEGVIAADLLLAETKRRKNLVATIENQVHQRL